MVINLTELANAYGTDKGNAHHEAHNYTPTYQLFMGPYREQPLNFMEIGVNDPRFPGASLRMWNQYFTHEESKLYGLDINPPLGFDENKRIHLLKADQSSPAQISQILTQIEELDFVIDDGLHTFDCQINSFLMLFPKLKKKGVYFIEDCHAKDCHKTIEFFKYVDKDFYQIQGVNIYNQGKLIAVLK